MLQEDTAAESQVWLSKQKTFCGCSVSVFIDQHLRSGIRGHPRESQPAKWLCAAAITSAAWQQCLQGHRLLGSLHFSKWSLSIKALLEIVKGKRQVRREMGG